MRMFLITIFAVGVMGSMLGHLSPHRSSQDVVIVNRAAVADEGVGAQNATPVSTSQNGALDIRRSSDGHFYADVDVNGTNLHMLVDTGATGIALSRDDARSAGIATSIGMNDVVGEGADGSVHGEVVTVDRMTLGGAKAEAIPAIVLNSGGQSLLGQSFLAKFASVEIHGDTMTLR
ncbi:MAG: TIGR02281 family clan AA aspartic protease [Sphingomicrobium sp.]